MRRGRLLLLLAALGACTVDAASELGVAPSGTPESFSAFVQPVLQVGCASLDCHGDAGRPLRLYARNGLRAEVALRGQDASDLEILANMHAIAGLDPQIDRIDDHLLLLKPLAVEAGGLHHVGGDLWADRTHGVYRCLHAWLRSGVADVAARALCTSVLP